MAIAWSREKRPPLKLSKATRRPLVVVAVISYPLAYAAQALMGSGPNRWPTQLVFVLLTLVSVGALFVLYAFAQNRAQLGMDELDERQRQLRDQAHVQSYRVMTAAVILGVAATQLYLLIHGSVRLGAGASSFLPVLIGCALYLPSMPYVMLAWLEPDDPGDA